VAITNKYGVRKTNSSPFAVPRGMGQVDKPIQKDDEVSTQPMASNILKYGLFSVIV